MMPDTLNLEKMGKQSFMRRRLHRCCCRVSAQGLLQMSRTALETHHILGSDKGSPLFIEQEMKLRWKELPSIPHKKSVILQNSQVC